MKLHYIFHIVYYCQRMNFPTTLQHKKTQLIINSIAEIRSGLVLFNYFSLHSRSPLLLIFYYSCNSPTQFLVLFSYSKDINPINLLIPSFTYSVLDLIAFFSFLVTINPITCLLASLTHRTSDCLIPTK